MNKVRENPHLNNWFVFLVAVFVLFVIPLSTYVVFRVEIHVPVFTVVAWLLGISLSAAAILIVLYRILPRFVAAGLECLLILLALFCAYNFYIGDYGGKVVGADADVFNSDYSWLEIALFAVVAGLLVFFYRKLRTHFQSVVIILILLSLPNFLPLITEEEPARKTRPQNPLFDNDFLAFSTESNVLHIILDGMQGTHFAKMLESDESMRSNFPGFTFFPDTTTSTEVTYLSFPSIFSGHAWDGIGSIKEFQIRSGMKAGTDGTAAASWLRDLGQARYRIQILSAPGSEMGEMPYYDDYFHTDFESDQPPQSFYLQKLLDFTLIKVMPWQGKRYVYKDGNWLFSRISDEKLPRANRAADFMSHYADKITRGPEQPMYKLIHLLSPHGPWTTGDNCAVSTTISSGYKQAECIMSTVRKLMGKLREIGVYDKSLIVINGDHGLCSPDTLPPAPKSEENLPVCIGNSNPLLMIKRPLAGADFRFNYNRAELIDIAPTIFKLLSIERRLPGVDVFDREQTLDRTRYFYQFRPNRNQAYKEDKVDEVLRFEIRGSIFDKNSWCRTLPTGCKPPQ